LAPRCPEFPEVLPLQTAARAILSCVKLSRISWSVTTLACLAAAVVVLIEGYRGYAAVAFVVAVSAAINLL
jgi:hypothetical protein